MRPKPQTAPIKPGPTGKVMKDLYNQVNIARIAMESTWNEYIVARSLWLAGMCDVFIKLDLKAKASEKSGEYIRLRDKLLEYRVKSCFIEKPMGPKTQQKFSDDMKARMQLSGPDELRRLSDSRKNLG